MAVVGEQLKRLRRKIEDYLRKNPQFIEPVARFLKIKLEDESIDKSNNNTTKS